MGVVGTQRMPSVRSNQSVCAGARMCVYVRGSGSAMAPCPVFRAHEVSTMYTLYQDFFIQIKYDNIRSFGKTVVPNFNICKTE